MGECVQGDDDGDVVVVVVVVNPSVQLRVSMVWQIMLERTVGLAQ